MGRKGKPSKTQATRRAAAKAATAKPKPPFPAEKVARRVKVQVALTRPHSVGGITYNPGTVTVPEEVAQVLRSQEAYADREEQAFRDRDPHGTIIAGGQRLIRVPGQQFDAYLAAAPVVGTLSGARG